MAATAAAQTRESRVTDSERSQLLDIQIVCVDLISRYRNQIRTLSVATSTHSVIHILRFSTPAVSADPMVFGPMVSDPHWTPDSTAASTRTVSAARPTFFVCTPRGTHRTRPDANDNTQHDPKTHETWAGPWRTIHGLW